MTATKTDSTIRVISLLRRIGSIFVVSLIFLLLFFSVYDRISNSFLISDLRSIYANGVSKFATVEKEYQIKSINNKPQLTFHYSFEESGKTYKNEYTLFQSLPQDADALTKIFTVHYIKENPEKNSLNIADEINRIETDIHESSTFWLILKILGVILFGFILFGQVISLISEIRNIDKPIEIPAYLKK